MKGILFQSLGKLTDELFIVSLSLEQARTNPDATPGAVARCEVSIHRCQTVIAALRDVLSMPESARAGLDERYPAGHETPWLG